MKWQSLNNLLENQNLTSSQYDNIQDWIKKKEAIILIASSTNKLELWIRAFAASITQITQSSDEAVLIMSPSSSCFSDSNCKKIFYCNTSLLKKDSRITLYDSPYTRLIFTYPYSGEMSIYRIFSHFFALTGSICALTSEDPSEALCMLIQKINSDLNMEVGDCIIPAIFKHILCVRNSSVSLLDLSDTLVVKEVLS